MIPRSTHTHRLRSCGEAPASSRVATLLLGPDQLVRFTDGYDEFPLTASDAGALGGVAPGGVVGFPFSQVVRLA